MAFPLLFGLIAVPALALDPEPVVPVTVPIGGALRPDNDAVWARLVELAGGRGARFAVLAMAADNPDRSAESIVAALNRHGAIAEYLRVAPRLTDVDIRQAVRDPELIARIRASQGVYFSGGAQERITATLYAEDGSPTPLLAAIVDLHRNGGVVAGTSAGAAIMSRTMFRDALDVLGVLRDGVQLGKEVDRGLGFIAAEVFIDQHFLKRGRFGRLLRAMADLDYKLGLGVDENSAAIFKGDEVEVVGETGALVIDLTDATRDPAIPGFNIRNARLSYLDNGDRYDLRNRRLLPAAEKRAGTVIDPNGVGFTPWFDREIFYPDILGDTSVIRLMVSLIGNRRRDAIGLAFSPDRREAFEFHFRKGGDSLGYFSFARGSASYTIANIHLDVMPVRMNLPLYEPVAAPW